MISQGLCISFKEEMLQEGHNIVTDTLKMALFTESGDANLNTTVYSATGEATATTVPSNGYTAGGATIANVTVNSDSSVVYVDFDDVTWTVASGATLTARGALVYNTSNSNKSVLAIDFGSSKSITNGTFRVKLPTGDKDNAMLRFE